MPGQTDVRTAPRPPAAAPATPAAPWGLMRSCALFDGLPQSCADRLMELGRKRRFRRGAVVLEQDTLAGSLHVLLSGRAQVQRTGPDGRTVILRLLGPGDHFGDCMPIDGLPQPATIRCTTPCDSLEIGIETLVELLPSYPDLSLALMRGLVARLRRAHRLIGALSCRTVAERIPLVLVDLAEIAPDGSWRLPTGLSITQLAAMVGATRQTVARCLARMNLGQLLAPRPDAPSPRRSAHQYTQTSTSNVRSALD